MENEHVLGGLMKKRAEIAGQLVALRAELTGLTIDLDNVDATIRLFRPDLDLAAIPGKPLPARFAAGKGEMARLLLGALRIAPAAMTIDELSRHVMGKRSMNAEDTRLRKIMFKRVHACLCKYRDNGEVASAMGPGNRMRWRIA